MPDLSNLYPIQIVDIYSDNRWSASEEKAKGTRGVIIKAGQGGYFSLPTKFIEEAEAVGLPWGIYWLIDSRFDASYHMRAIKTGFHDMNFGQLPWFWDCEKPRISMTEADYWKTPYAGNGLIESVLDKFLFWSGRMGEIYTSLGFSNLLGWNSPSFKFKPLYAKLSKRLLWSAQYNNFINQPTPFGPWSKGKWTLWQYRENPDYNYFHGNEEDWQALLNGTYSPPTTEIPPIVLPPIGEQMVKGTIISGFANIKTVDGSPSSTGLAMNVGDYAYGELSASGTDLVGFSHFYRVGGAKIELGEPCKANATNMSKITETEPGTNPNPIPIPTVTVTYTATLEDDVTHKIYKGTLTEQ